MIEMHLHFMIVKHVFLIKIHETKIIIELDLNSGLSTSVINWKQAPPTFLIHPHSTAGPRWKVRDKIQVSADDKISVSLPRRGNSTIPPTRAFPRWILKF